MTTKSIKEEAARRAFATGLSPAEREAEAARIEAELTAEAKAAEQAKAAAAIAAEAAQERARIAAVIRAGSSTGRPRQATRLALSTPISAEGAAAVLMTLPTDAAASPEALSVPDAIGTFGSPAAVTERRRIGAILGHPEAADRFTTASALALDTSLDLGQAVAALMAAPRQEAKKYPSFEQRQREAGSFGPSFDNGGGQSKGERLDAMWSRAVREANSSIGAIPAPVATTTPPNPSMTEDDALRGGAGLVGGALADLTRG